MAATIMSAHNRIIPARAGFTPHVSYAFTPTWDHPRSRGVYATSSPSKSLMSGSSPLARGLLSCLWTNCKICRIIPARAGFTATSTWLAVPSPDHPRSRGVYAPWLRRTFARTGSSPLARGLQIEQCGYALSGRIIPARAGFTILQASRPRHCEDHPRSRGVYAPSPVRSQTNAGSSPLARGLLMVRGSRIGTRRIIPARAGFTTCATVS